MPTSETAQIILESPRLQALVRYWHAKRLGRPMPSRLEIDPIEIPGLLPIVLIAEVTGVGAKMRLLGTDATAAYGQETHGKLVSELDLGDFTPFWLEAFAKVIGSHGCTSASGQFRNAFELCSIETVLLPLSDDGQTVSHIFGGLKIRPLFASSVTRQTTPHLYVELARTG